MVFRHYCNRNGYFFKLKAEGDPPFGNIHPVRAMFMIKNTPPTGLTKPENWSEEFNNFVKKCLTIEPKV